jgi:hypothetical protein
MNIFELAQICEQDIKLYWVHDAHLNPGSKVPWRADIKNALLKEDGCLISACGMGKTADMALEDYVKEIRGKTLVFDYMGERKEIGVPTTLEYTKED